MYDQGIDRDFINLGYKFIAGIDEAGRGPLAGPVVAAAVIFLPEIVIDGIDDSKKLSAEEREKLYKVIKEKAISVGIGIISSEVIDNINILEATKEAMSQAVSSLTVTADILIIDGITALSSPIKQSTIKRGDSLSQSIAAASIIAKVTRDRLMLEYDMQYPHYLFGKHKGYGTWEHLDRIKKFGPCEIHRKSFKGVKEHILNLKPQT
ncbi:MAG: ribonuclease HII [Nitrospinae bacterium]|nr:ribonuclease HII [Nitrospinota bacterium]